MNGIILIAKDGNSVLSASFKKEKSANLKIVFLLFSLVLTF